MCDRIHRRGEEGISIATVWLSIGKKAGAIKRMDNERDSLGGFHLRIAAFDAGCANAAAEQAINREKGWWAMPTLHIS